MSLRFVEYLVKLLIYAKGGRAFLDFALPRLKARLGDLSKGVAPRGRGKKHG